MAPWYGCAHMLVWKASRSHSIPWTMLRFQESKVTRAVESSDTWRLKNQGTTSRIPTSPIVGQKCVRSQQNALASCCSGAGVALAGCSGIGPDEVERAERQRQACP